MLHLEVHVRHMLTITGHSYWPINSICRETPKIIVGCDSGLVDFVRDTGWSSSSAWSPYRSTKAETGCLKDRRTREAKMSSAGPTWGSPVSEVMRLGTPPKECICKRPNRNVRCMCCGWYIKDARVRKTCDVHPRITYVMDILECGKCSSRVLQEK